MNISRDEKAKNKKNQKKSAHYGKSKQKTSEETCQRETLKLLVIT